MILPNLEALSREAAALIVEQTRERYGPQRDVCHCPFRRFYSGEIVRSSGRHPPSGIKWTGVVSISSGQMNGVSRKKMRQATSDWLMMRCFPGFRFPKETFTGWKGRRGRQRERETTNGRSGISSDTSGTPNFDLILLGVGEDGHTASLFPGSETLRETEKLVLPVYVKEPGLNRLTLSLRVLNGANHILFLVSGRSKAAIVAENPGRKSKTGESFLPGWFNLSRQSDMADRRRSGQPAQIDQDKK